APWRASKCFTSGQITCNVAKFLAGSARRSRLIGSCRRRSAERSTSHRTTESQMRRLPNVVAALAAVFSAGILAAPGPASADIFQWEYVNPADPGQGKQQSMTLCPGGAGVNAVPGADLRGRDLT